MKQYTRKKTLELLCDFFAKELIADSKKLNHTILYGRNSLMDYEDNELEQLYEDKIGEKITIKY